MRSRNQRHTPATPRCRPCATSADHCHATLVLHADGSAECDEARRCEAREDRHDLWVPCTDIGCGCTGDEHADPQLLIAA